MTGVLPDAAIQGMIGNGSIGADIAFAESQVQPASLDLRLGKVAYRVRASFLASGGSCVADRLTNFEMHRFDLCDGAVLEKGCVYVVPLMERLALPETVSAVCECKELNGQA